MFTFFFFFCSFQIVSQTVETDTQPDPMIEQEEEISLHTVPNTYLKKITKSITPTSYNLDVGNPSHEQPSSSQVVFNFVPPPTCSHGLECVLRMVKKGTPKEGMRFYVCQKMEDKCGFFQWESAPKCRMHNRPAFLAESSKPISKGKLFWRCSDPFQPCDFFKWHSPTNPASTKTEVKLSAETTKALFDAHEEQQHLFE